MNPYELPFVHVSWDHTARDIQNVIKVYRDGLSDLGWEEGDRLGWRYYVPQRSIRVFPDPKGTWTLTNGGITWGLFRPTGEMILPELIPCGLARSAVNTDDGELFFTLKDGFFIPRGIKPVRQPMRWGRWVDACRRKTA